MILIDSSVWIDFFNGTEGNAVSALEKLITDEEEAYISEYILTEVLQGFREDREYDAARECLLKFPIAGLRDKNSYIEAAQIYRKCRRQGITIRKTADCLIARTAMENDLYLLHKDNDFDLIASVCPLKIYV
ncbi:MAG: PIN domain nuclease [Desulfobacterales bacterium]